MTKNQLMCAFIEYVNDNKNKESSKSINSLNEPCKTHGAIYTFIQDNNIVLCGVELPFQLILNSYEYSNLANELHEAIENVLAKYFKGH